MGRWMQRVAALVVMAVLASVLGTGPAAAQEAPATPLVPEVFVPEVINRNPQGSPPAPPADEGQLLGAGLEGVSAASEVVERRTEDSRTFVAEDGTFQTVFYGAPVNYQDANGAWQPVDNALVPSAAPGGGLRNAAGAVEVSLPAVLGAAPVRVAKGDLEVAFSLRNSQGATPSLGPPPELPTPATDAAAKATATYAGALSGVDVVYTATSRGVKEDIVLSGPQAPSSFDFSVTTSPGLIAQESAGGISFVDGEGNERARFAPPFAYDASFEASPSATSFTEDAVSLRIVETSPQLVVRLAAEPAWLGAPERAWPVVIDPVLTIEGATADTYLRQAGPDTNYGSSTRLLLGSGTSTRRILHGKTIQNFFDEPVTLFSATLRLYATTDTTASTVGPVGAYPLATPGWNSHQATWNDRLTGVRWNNPGADFDAQPVFVKDNATGPVGWRSWPITEAAQAWMDGQRGNLGVLLKYLDESSGALLSFASSNEADTSLLPRIVVQWEPLQGVRAPYSQEEFDLGAAGQASVNVASGNLTIADSDLAIAGTGLPATVDRFYQSRALYVGSVGNRWRMWPQSEERLGYANGNNPDFAFARNGDVMWHGGPEELLVFSQDDGGSFTAENPNGTYTSPHGYRASLVLTSEAGKPVFKLSDHASGTVRNFYASGYLRDITDRNGNKLNFGYTYDAATDENFMVSMTDTQGRVTTFERAGQYKVTKMVDPSGRTHAYAYDRADAKANLASYTDPAGKVTRYDYSGSVPGLLSRVTDPNGNATTFAYDAEGRLTSLTRVSDPATGAGPTWRFDYSTPWQTKVSDPSAKTTTHHFDRRGRVTKVVDAMGHVRQSSYDANSNVIDRTSAMGNKSIATFDPATSNLLRSQLPTGAKTSLEYADPAQKYFPTKMTNQQGNALTFGYDPKGNVDKITDSMPTAGTSRFAYNPNGTVSSSTDAKGNMTTYGYDAKANLTRVTPPAPLGATTIAYDGLSRVTSTTDGKGQTTTYAYDALDRVTRTGFADGLVVTSRYDAGGRLVERGDATGTTTYIYDRLNRLVEERLPGSRTNAYTYDGVGNLKAMTDATGKVSYGYNAVNLVTSVVEPGEHTTTFAYDDDDNRTTTAYPNGVTQRVTYDASDRLTSIEGTKGTSVLTRFAYSYARSGTDTGLRRSVTDKANNTTAYSYDALDRLVQAKTTSSSGSVQDDFRYGYDPVGNRTSETVRQSGLLGASDVTTTSSFNAADQLTARGDVTYSYDANGNQSGSSAGQALAYNGADQTTSLKRAGGSALAATYAGATQVERASAGATTFTNTLLGVSAGGTTGYTRDPAGALVGIRGANRSYYLFDGLGSVVAVTNSSGSVTNSYTYDPFGVTTETKALLTDVFNPWRYAGQYQDTTTGLYKMGARYYQPELGRWTQQDPSGQEANAYLYAGGNPVNFVDPNGTLSFNPILTTPCLPYQDCPGVRSEVQIGCAKGVTGAFVGQVALNIITAPAKQNPIALGISCGIGAINEVFF
jgi:RHS repeat-associated protein